MKTRERRRLSRKPSIEEEITVLRDLDLKGLRVRWRNVFGKPAPEHLTRYLLFRIMAYRLQADRLGDLDAETRKMLEQAAGQQPSDVSKDLIKLDQRRFAPPPGTVLVREWDRTSRRVMVMSDGYAWNGKTFDSLSQVALAITGTKWNGPRFFGLRDKRPQIPVGGSSRGSATSLNPLSRKRSFPIGEQPSWLSRVLIVRRKPLFVRSPTTPGMWMGDFRCRRRNTRCLRNDSQKRATVLRPHARKLRFTR